MHKRLHGVTTTKNGILFHNDFEFKRGWAFFDPQKKYSNGNLSTDASEHLIFGVCESLLELFVRPMGVRLDRNEKWGGYINMDVVKKHRDGTLPYKRSKNNLTRGWCYLLSGVLHRFFYEKYDLYKVQCPFDKSGKDYHWWLESKCRKHVIDLTEEQYLKRGIKDIRKGGKKNYPMGNSYGKKTKNMAFLVATHIVPDAVELTAIQNTGYTTKNPKIIQNLQSKVEFEAFDPKIHANVRSVKFHIFKNESQMGWDGHLVSEITKFWSEKNSFIRFDHNDSLKNPIKLVEKISNAKVGKENFFHVEELVLESNRTKVKITEETFSDTIFSNDKGTYQSKNLDQKVRIYNLEQSFGKRLHSEMDDYWVEMNEAIEGIVLLQQKFLDAHIGFYQLFDEVNHRNRKCSADRIKDQFDRMEYRSRNLGLGVKSTNEKERVIKRPWVEEGISFEDWKNGKSPSSPINEKKALDYHYDKMRDEGHKTESPDWIEHFKRFRGKGLLRGMYEIMEDIPS